jgi:hypothetical protein
VTALLKGELVAAGKKKQSFSIKKSAYKKAKKIPLRGELARRKL